MIHLHLHLCNLSDYDYGRYKGFKFRKTLTIKNVSTPDDKLAYFRRKLESLKCYFCILAFVYRSSHLSITILVIYFPFKAFFRIKFQKRNFDSRIIS
jgi:hypothetical protein